MYYANIYYIINYVKFFHKFFIKTVNILLSQISNVNLSLKNLEKLNILRYYLIKSYKGYCHSIGKPVRGQRTWSNAWTSFRINNTLRSFINKTKQLSLLKTSYHKNKIDFKSVKKRYSNSNNSIKKSPLKSNNVKAEKTWF